MDYNGSVIGEHNATAEDSDDDFAVSHETLWFNIGHHTPINYWRAKMHPSDAHQLVTQNDEYQKLEKNIDDINKLLNKISTVLHAMDMDMLGQSNLSLRIRKTQLEIPGFDFEDDVNIDENEE